MIVASFYLGIVSYFAAERFIPRSHIKKLALAVCIGVAFHIMKAFLP